MNKLLMEGAAIMREGGLKRGEYGHDQKRNVPHCAVGAVNCHYVMNMNHISWDDYQHAIHILAEHITQYIPPEGVLDTYNNHHATKNGSTDFDKVFAWSNMLCATAEDVAMEMEIAAQGENT